VLEALMLADVDVMDIEAEDGRISVFAPQADYFKAKQALADAFGDIDFEVDEIQFIPQSSSPINAENRELLEKFLDMLNDLEDVQNVYSNVEL